MPINDRLFATGGSSIEFNKSCYEIVLSHTGKTYGANKMRDMSFRREFHSMCYFDDKCFVVSGSRITADNADRKVELYRTGLG